MGGPWEEYQQKQTPEPEGPWKEYRTVTIPQVEQAPTKPQRNYSAMEVPGNALMNLIPSARNYAGGMWNAVTHPVESVKTLGSALAGAGVKILSSEAQQAIKDIDPDKVQGFVDTANAIGGVYAQRYGSWNAIKRTAAEDPVGTAGDLSTFVFAVPSGAIRVVGVTGRMAGNPMVAESAKIMSQFWNDPTKWSNPAKFTIGAIHPNTLTSPMYALNYAGKGVSGGVKHVYNTMMDPEGAVLRSAMGDAGPQYVHALRTAGEIVPGSKPTGPQAAAGIGTGYASAIDTAVKSNKLPTDIKDKYYHRIDEQDAARTRSIQEVGGTPGDIIAAKSKRKRESDPLYDDVSKGIIDINENFLKPDGSTGTRHTRDFKKVIGRPVIRDAIDNAMRNMRNKGTSIYDDQGRLTGDGVNAIKKQLDDMAKDKARNPSSAIKDDVMSINDAKDFFLNWAEQPNHIPALKTARERFGDLSKPIDEMKLGQHFEYLLTQSLGEGTAALKAESFAKAVHPENLEATIQKILPHSYAKTIEDVSPRLRKNVDAVLADLKRNKRAERDATRGSTIPSATRAGSETIPSSPMWFSKVVTGINAILKVGKGAIDQKTAVALVMHSLDPKETARFMDLALKRKDDLINKTGRGIGRTGRAASRVMHTPAIYNILSPNQQEQRNTLIGRSGYTPQ